MSEQIRSPDSFPEYIVGHLEQGESALWLVTEQGRWRVTVDSFVKGKQLKGWTGQWKRRRASKKIVVVQPWELERQRIKEMQGSGTSATAPVVSSSRDKRAQSTRREVISPEPKPAHSRLQRDPVHFARTAVAQQPDRRQQTLLIRDLAQSDSVDDWVQIASCWQAEHLRDEVEAALRRIGWQRIEGVLSTSDAWPARFWIKVKRNAERERRAAQAQRDLQLQHAAVEDRSPARYRPRVPDAWLEAGWEASDAASWFAARSGWIPPPDLALQWWKTGLRDVSLIERLNEYLTPAEFKGRLEAQQAVAQLTADAFASQLCAEFHPATPAPSPRDTESAPTEFNRSGEIERSSPFQLWLEQNEWAAERARLSSSLWHSFMAILYDESLSIDIDGTDLSVGQPSQAWLDEVISKADNLRPLMRRVPVWPAIFESPELTVVASESAGRVAAWVGRGHEGLLLSFDTLTFRAWGDVKHPSFRFAVGAAISWFVDLAIVPVRPSPPGINDIGVKVPTGSRPSKEARRYVPMPSYHDHVDAVWRRNRTSPMAYRISGFRRRLPDGQEPSDWALGNAPAHIRAVMEPDETFVRDHIRGGHEEMDRLRIYLSKYSLLADTVGLARRR